MKEQMSTDHDTYEPTVNTVAKYVLRDVIPFQYFTEQELTKFDETLELEVEIQVNYQIEIDDDDSQYLAFTSAQLLTPLQNELKNAVEIWIDKNDYELIHTTCNCIG